LFDLDAARVEQVMAGRMPFLERGAEVRLPAALSTGRLRATTARTAVAEHEIVVVTLATHVDEFHNPDLLGFDRQLDELLDHMHDGQLLLLRSTVFPGVTERLARRAAARALSLDIAHCPERIAQAHALEELGVLPQVVGGVTPSAAKRATQLFGRLGVAVLELSAVEAELAKLFSNAYRYLNFAVSNQLWTIASKYGADFARIHAAITRDYPRMSGFAPAGFVGGPCLLKDTLQLAAFHHDFPMGQAAVLINEGLPGVLVEAAKRGRDLRGATAAILGMAFKGDCDDPRASLAYKLRKLLTLECARVLCTDPYIEDPSFVSLETALREADIVFIGACHREYRDLRIERPLVDPFNFVRR
jgi:UDP-N-acetyl-D-mannosaminuronic acid dehydrogenase